jgi:hypothetical protein
MAFQRDMTYDGGGGNDYYTVTPYREDEDFYEKEVMRVCPNAFMKRTTDTSYVYQIRLRKWFFWSEPLGQKHFFKDQTWCSAYAKLKELGKL